MLTKRGLLLLGTLVLLALGLGLAFASLAFAEEQPHYIKKSAEITEELNGQGTIGEFFIEGKIGLAEVTVLCKGVDNKIKIGAKWKSKLTIEFTECTVFDKGLPAPGCKVKEPIKISLYDQLVYKKGAKGEEILDIFYPAEGKYKGSTFAKVVITGCEEEALDTVSEATGSAIASMSVHKSGEEAEKITLKFKGTEGLTGTYLNHETGVNEEAGKLTFDGGKAFLKGEITQELESKEKYGVS